MAAIVLSATPSFFTNFDQISGFYARLMQLVKKITISCFLQRKHVNPFKHSKMLSEKD
jgi:hypothetical protein